jgi:hypothetical protein
MTPGVTETNARPPIQCPEIIVPRLSKVKLGCPFSIHFISWVLERHFITVVGWYSSNIQLHNLKIQAKGVAAPPRGNMAMFSR